MLLRRPPTAASLCGGGWRLAGDHSCQMNEQSIRVFYPASDARIVLRTEEDWNANIEPVRADGCGAEFLISTKRPFFYFKLVLIRDDNLQWSRGENFLAIATSGTELDIYPYFAEETRCSVCELMPPLASASGRAHRFRVFVPPGYYENTLKKYPVLYMHDGHNLFLKEEAFIGNTWRTDEVLTMLDKMNAIEQAIVVGIYPNERMSEYTLPGYENYGRFLVEKLKPLIDAKYRTLVNAPNTAVMGSSLGGVVSFYLGWQWPDVFGKVGCLSSTFAYRDDLIDRVASEPKRNMKIYLDSGWPHDNYEPTRVMRDQLIRKGYSPGSELFYLAFPEAKHEENAWAGRSHIPFQFFFGKLPALAEPGGLQNNGRS
jgi:predicted alpha/beta superfamily hydrolase